MHLQSMSILICFASSSLYLVCLQLLSDYSLKSCLFSLSESKVEKECETEPKTKIDEEIYELATESN